jgi:uncharacterized membrane protein YkoI
MKTLKTLLLVTSAALLAACASSKDCGSCPTKQKAACSTSTSCSTSYSCSKPCAVPANILAAAKSSVPGFAMTSYDTDTDNGRKVYELDGTANGRQCEIKVDASGKVLKIDRD